MLDLTKEQSAHTSMCIRFLLSVNNKLLNGKTESVRNISLPADSSFEEPDEKLRWLAGYFSECEPKFLC